MRAAPATGPGRYFAAARTRDDHGHVIEDTAMVAVGERRWPDPALPPEEALEVMQADSIAVAAEMDLAVLTPELRLTPGSRDEVRISVSTQLPSEAHGEVQLVSPFGIWDLVSPPAQGFSVTAREPAVLRFGVTVPATARPGDPVLGAGQGDVLRPGPVQPGHTDEYRRGLETATLPANNVR